MHMRRHPEVWRGHHVGIAQLARVIEAALVAKLAGARALEVRADALARPQRQALVVEHARGAARLGRVVIPALLPKLAHARLVVVLACLVPFSLGVVGAHGGRDGLAHRRRHVLAHVELPGAGGAGAARHPVVRWGVGRGPCGLGALCRTLCGARRLCDRGRRLVLGAALTLCISLGRPAASFAAQLRVCRAVALAGRHPEGLRGRSPVRARASAHAQPLVCIPRV
mmetsp:Transcript_18289/g.56684  ORF Transcript_18289/g.56684 Transcript_18289/m.56684 type:complete len:226 (-) Transcript_18289:89-766(-)